MTGPCAYLPLHHHAEQTHNNAHMEQQYESGRIFSFHNYKFIFIYRQGGQTKIREFSPFWRPTRFYKNLKKMGFFGIQSPVRSGAAPEIPLFPC